MAQYQSFSNCPGVSKSDEKLSRIKLPNNLNGKSVLDIGCNEGFFCLEAKRRGASYVMGVDKNRTAIESAKKRAKEAGLDIDYLNIDAVQIPDKKFDYIIFLSALHYIEDPTALFERLKQALAPGGTLILECGVSTRPGITIQRVLRSIDDRIFPSFDMLTKVWLADFAVRLISNSPDQKGDPIPRNVFHCQLRKSNVVLVVGKGGIGKTVLASQFTNAVRISCDEILGPVRDNAKSHYPAAQKRFDELKSQNNSSIRLAWDIAREDPEIRSFVVKQLTRIVLACKAAPLIVLEGYALNGIQSDVKEALANSFHVWITSRE